MIHADYILIFAVGTALNISGNDYGPDRSRIAPPTDGNPGDGVGKATDGCGSRNYANGDNAAHCGGAAYSCDSANDRADCAYF